MRCLTALPSPRVRASPPDAGSVVPDKRLILYTTSVRMFPEPMMVVFKSRMAREMPGWDEAFSVRHALGAAMPRGPKH